MTALPPHQGLSPDAAKRLPLAGALIWLERGLAAELGWIVLAWAGFLALGLLGLADWLPGDARLALLGAVVVGSIAGIVRYAARAPLPSRSDVLARLDAGGALPVGTSSFTDHLPAALDGDIGELLWQRARRDAFSRRARIGLPRLSLPKALFTGLIGCALLLLAGLALAGRDAPERVADAFSPWRTPLAAFAFRVEMTPPDYTALPAESFSVDGGETLRLDMLDGGTVQLRAAGEDGAWQLRHPDGRLSTDGQWMPDRSGTWRILRGSRELAAVEINLVADGIPVVRFAGEPAKAASGALRLLYRLTDDHGLASLSLRVEGGEAEMRETLLNEAVQPGEGQLFADLTSDPRAGEEARLTLVARDGAGNEGVSAPILVKLPVRVFSDPVAREIVSIRKALLEGGERKDAVRRLTDIAERPSRFDGRLDIFAGLRAANWRLLYQVTAEGRMQSAQILWDVAVDLEDGGTSRAMDDLRAAMERLAQEAGSKDDELLAALTKQLEQAMGEYLRRQMEAAMNAGEMPSQQMMQNMSGAAPMVDSGFLDAMMADLKDRLAAGDTEGAMQALANLRGLMESIQFGPSAPDPAAAARAQKAGEAAEALRDIARRQEELRAGTIAESVMPERTMLDMLGSEQRDLGTALGDLQSVFGEAGVPVPESLGDAGVAMEAAAQALANGDPYNAARAQTLALEKLGEAARAADQAAAAAAQAAAGGQMQPGASGSGIDPLGRPGQGFGQGQVKLPDEQQLRRVQEIRAMIEERAADPARSPQERAYYLRLLKRF